MILLQAAFALRANQRSPISATFPVWNRSTEPWLEHGRVTRWKIAKRPETRITHARGGRQSLAPVLVFLGYWWCPREQETVPAGGNQESLALKSRIQPNEFGNPLTIRIRNPNSTHKENPESKIQWQSVIQNLESGMHSLELKTVLDYIKWVLRQINTLVNINHFIYWTTHRFNSRLLYYIGTLDWNNKISVRRLRKLALGQWVSTPKGSQFHLLYIFLFARLFKHRFFSV